MTTQEKLDALLSAARWRKRLHYTRSYALATWIVGLIIGLIPGHHALSLSLVLAGSITYCIALAVK